jgi:ribosome maturation factor RimP
LETNALVGEKYTLDVSSPGVGKPLKFKRQYPKNVGRSLSVQLKDSDKKIEGPLHSVTDDSIIIQYEEKVKIEGTKKKELKTITHDIPFDNIKNAVVKISFSS